VSTTSSHIAGLLYRQLLGRGIAASIHTERTTWTYKDEKRTGNAWSIDFLRGTWLMKPVGDVWHVRIRSITKAKTWPPSVIDFTVEGVHDFVAGTIVHNCDGDRVLIEVVDGAVAVFNRQGTAKVTNVGAAMLAPFRNLTAGRWVFDGEVVGRTLWLFDMPTAGRFTTENTPFMDRYATLTATLTALAADPALIGLVPTAAGEDAKRAMLTAAQEGRKEGVMLRRAFSGYQAGRSASLMKYKFIKEVDAYVTKIGIGGRRNAELAVHDDDGNEVIIGQVTTIGRGGVSVGDVVEVQYLYVVNPAAPRLFQPRILRSRTDKAPVECHLAQLANAVTDRTVK
jgi:hypothetical protein